MIKNQRFNELRTVVQIPHLLASIVVSLTLGTVTFGESPNEVAQEQPKAPERITSPEPVVDKQLVSKLRGQIGAYLRKQNGGSVPAPPAPSGNADVWCFQRYEAANKDKKKLFHLIAEDLALSDVMAKGDAPQRAQSVCIAIEAARCVLTRLEDKKLSPTIIDAYVLPLFSNLSTDSASVGNQFDVLQNVGHLYLTAGRLEQSVAAYQTLVERAPNRNMADFGRFRLARVYEAHENYSAALHALAGISDDDGMAGAKGLAPALRDKLRIQTRERNCCNVD